jgi:molybdopterin synthase sulfur carrier subunit
MSLPAPPDVLGLLHELSARFGPELRGKILNAEGDGLHHYAVVMINGRHIEHLQGVQTKLSDEDTAAVFPVIAGG